jgi:hypothetical protein
MLRKYLSFVFAVLAALSVVVAGKSAKAIAPANQYGPISVTVSTSCPTATTIVNLPISQPIQSITVWGEATGSMHLYDADGNINATFQVGLPYSFTATGSDVLYACLNAGNTGTVSFQGQLNMDLDNWAGYTVEGLSASPNHYEYIIGNWQVPVILSCSFSEVSESTQWIGLGGAQFTGSSEIEQIGTDQQCHHEVKYNTAVYQDYTKGQKGFSIITNACPITVAPPCPNSFTPSVFANDMISAQVAYQADGSFFLFETDYTQKWTARETLRPKTSTAQYSAEWIEESQVPDMPLTNTTQVQFTNCYADGYPISSAGPSVQMLTMQPQGSPILAQASAVQGGNSFTISFPSH